MKVNKHIRIIFIILLAILMLSLGIFGYWMIYTNNIEKNNQKAIRAVANQLFTCPNQELITIYNEMYDNIDKELKQSKQGTDNSDKQFSTLDGSKMEDKLREMYQPYFTKQGYQAFEKRFVSYNSIYSTTIGYQIVVNAIEIKQSKSIPTNYSITVQISHGKEGEQLKDIEVEGSAQFYEEKGKLSYIQFKNEELYKVLSSFKNPNMDIR